MPRQVQSRRDINSFGLNQKISYKRRDFDSVHENSLSYGMSRKQTKKKNSGGKGLKSLTF